MAEHPRLTAISGGLDEPARPVRRADENGAGARRPVVVAREPLWREILGEQLRSLRLEQGEKLTETAGRAGISPQYLSEVERGRKEPSSEMIAALAGALGITLGDLTLQVAEELRRRHLVALSSTAIPQGYAMSRPAAPQRQSGQAMLSLVA